MSSRSRRERFSSDEEIGNFGYGTEFWVGRDVESIRSVVLGVRELPRESPKYHTHENDGDTPNVG